MILVTGGAGYIGSHCVKLLQKKNEDIVVLDNLSKGHAEAVTGAELIIGDVGDEKTLVSIIKNKKIDAVLHLAALSNVGESVKNPHLYFRENVDKMKILLDVMGEYGVKYIIFSSSAAIFGEPEYLPIDENHPKNPINPYGQTKLKGEELLVEAEIKYGIKYCALRYFNAAGASKDGLIGESHTPEYHLIPLICKNALGQTKSFSVYGDNYPTFDGTCIRDYIHVEDLAMAHYKALLYLVKENSSHLFNLGSQNGFSVKEIIEEFENVSGRAMRYHVEPRRAGDPAKLVASNHLAKQILGWEPQHSDIQTILKDAWYWETHKRF